MLDETNKPPGGGGEEINFILYKLEIMKEQVKSNGALCR